ncbi:hypothetical protein [Loigolactobacillus backii]|uniref:hypothetical protein n=1 Tax=Loigolactobacillus backii TaxID=375175 RepID=UPI000B09ECA7|nr:hypothetical protein [Loigolactobacillus backii]
MADSNEKQIAADLTKAWLAQFNNQDDQHKIAPETVASTYKFLEDVVTGTIQPQPKP